MNERILYVKSDLYKTAHRFIKREKNLCNNSGGWDNDGLYAVQDVFKTKF